MRNKDTGPIVADGVPSSPRLQEKGSHINLSRE